MAVRKDRPAPRRTPGKTPGKKDPEPFSGSARADLSPDEVRKLISEAAYYRAKQRGFAPVHEVEDWIQAEAEVMRRIGGRPNRSP